MEKKHNFANTGNGFNAYFDRLRVIGRWVSGKVNLTYRFITGRTVKDESDEDSGDEDSKYPGLTQNDLERPTQDQLKKILFHNYAKHGNYCLKVEDNTPEAVFNWFGLKRPASDYLHVKLLESKKKAKKTASNRNSRQIASPKNDSNKMSTLEKPTNASLILDSDT